MTALEALRLLVQLYDDKQFQTCKQQYAWHMARKIVEEADAMRLPTEEQAA